MMHLNPRYPVFYLYNLGRAHLVTGQCEKAIASLKQYLTSYPNILGAHLTLAAVYSELGREAEAQAETAEVLRLNPNASVETYRQNIPYKDPVVLERTLAALRKA